MTVDLSVDTQSYYPIPVKAIFISDVHLGTKHSKAEQVLHFLSMYDPEKIYLVGDIIDFWHFRRTKMYWPQSHMRFLVELGELAKTKEVIYVPGNHDEDLRVFDGSSFNGIKIMNKAWHTTNQGKRYLIIHGDEFDAVIQNCKWLALIGDWLYEAALHINQFFSFAQKKFGFPYWSFSAWSKKKVKRVVQFVGKYETAVMDAVAKYDTDGVICGHIHCAANKHIGADFASPAPPVHYLNCGDWVESCTAIVEDMDGSLDIVYY